VFLFQLFVVSANHVWKIFEAALCEKCGILYKYKNISMDDHNHFQGILMVLASSVGVQGRNILLFVDLMPLICKMGRKICVLSTKLHKLDAFHEH
jgi:hypothetical protein